MTTDVLKLPGDYIINAVKGDMTIDLTSLDRVGTLVVNGNFRVNGHSSQSSQTTTPSSVFDDNLIVLNNNETNLYVSEGISGIVISRGNGSSIDNAATLLFNDNAYWSNGVYTNRGIFEAAVAGVPSAIRVDGIRISSSSTSLNLLGVNNPTATISVKGTQNYENQVVDDDDIPNKKYVDDLFNALSGSNISGTVAYDLSFFIGGRLVYPESVVGGFVSTKQIQIDAGGPGSVAKCITAPTNKSQILTIKKNSEAIGTITFSVGDTVGSLSIPQPVALAIGDIVSVITPLDIDAQFADIFVTLVGKSLLVTLE